MRNLIRQKLDLRKKGYTWLSKKTGLDKSYISRLANNKSPRPSLNTAYKIARAFNSAIEDIWILE